MLKQCCVLKNGAMIAGRAQIADTFFTRLKGLLRAKELGNREGLLIYPCNQIHTFGMSFSIDAVFLSEKNEVLHVESAMAPGKISKYVKNAKMVLELREGAAREQRIKTSDQLTLKYIVPVELDA